MPGVPGPMRPMISSDQTRGSRRLPTRTAFLQLTLTALFSAGIAWLAARQAGADPPANGRVTDEDAKTGRAGADSPPWGQLRKVRMVTEKPEEFVAASQDAPEVTEWSFPRHTTGEVRARLGGAGLSQATLAELFLPARCEQTATGVTMRPADALLLALSAEERRVLYKELRRAEAGHFQTYPFSFPAGKFDDIVTGRVEPETRALVRSLLYRVGKADCFSDPGTVMNQLPDRAERLRLLKTLTRHETLLLKVAINRDTDVSRLVQYWSTPSRRKDLQPLLESLTRAEGGVMLDVVHLLPAFARARLYTYPERNTAGPRDYDCHWTCLNFFRREPDPGFLDSAIVATALREEYDVIPAATRLGDILLYTTDGANVVHSCVYIADDVVFTKNGANPMQPWTFMTLPEMEIVYPSDEPYKVVTYRLKSRLLDQL
jgi:hypothetical protein